MIPSIEDLHRVSTAENQDNVLASLDNAGFKLLLASVATLLLVLFLPLVLVGSYSESFFDKGKNAAEATVGVAVILRAVAQRMFRAGARNILRTAFGTVTRAATRAATTRVLRVFMKNASVSAIRSLDETKSEPPPLMARYPIVSLALGVVGTAISFCGVCYIAGSYPTLATEGGELHVFTASLIAALPLIWMYVLVQWSAKTFKCSSQVSTGFDGLLIQAYFTGSGSFLPLTTDLQFEGEKKNCCTAALVTLSGLLMLQLVLLIPFSGEISVWQSFLSGTSATYLFVFVFPVRPLFGHSIWQYSKTLWCSAFLVAILAFLFGVPETLANLL